ncbi:hypothetical protein [Nocardia sp. NPDC020380]|uniref:hypothetical protein n=1 Tax=Nocardia sp. NPDC020380 TaxID=3364309 RepID=UPI0037A6131F
MSYEEKRTWILGVTALLSYAIYLVIVLLRARETALAAVSYAAPLLWAIGGAFVAIGAGLGMVLALTDVDRFWIANAIYLGFTLGAIVSASAKLVAYRRGLRPW